MPQLTFWYEFASTYSYLSAMRIEAAAAAAGVAVTWQPFLLGPIFKAHGWSTSPFNLYPAKGRYMVRDVGRIAASRGLAFHMPEPFPANALMAARLAVIGTRQGWVAPFSRAVFEAEFALRRDIADALGVSGDPAARPIVDTLARDADARVSQAAARAAARLGVAARDPS